MSIVTTISDRDTWFFRSSTWFYKIFVNGLSGNDGAIFLNGKNLADTIDDLYILSSTFEHLSGNWQNAYTIVLNNSSNWDDAFTTVQMNSSIWDNTSDVQFLSSSIDSNTDKITDVSLVSSNWDDAYGWGDHTEAGYLTTEADPVYSSDKPKLIFNNDDFNLDTELLTLDTGLIHSFIKVNNSIFCGSRTTPTTITKIHDCNNMNTGGTTKITLTGYNYAESVTYMKSVDRIFFLLLNAVCVLNPNDMTYSILPVSITGGTGGSGGISTDGEHIYIATYTSPNSRIAKFSYNGSTLTRIQEVVISGRAYAHSLSYDKDSGFLFTAGASNQGWFGKIKPSDLTVSTVQLPLGNGLISDDIAISGDYVWGVMEASPFKIVRVKKTDLSYILITTNMTNAGYGCSYNKFDDCVYTCFNNSPGKILKINTKSMLMSEICFNEDLSYFNEIIFDEYRIFATTWQTPAKVIRTTVIKECKLYLLDENGNVKLTYDNGTLTTENFVGDGSQIINIATGNEGEIQFKKGAYFGSNSKFKYEEDENKLTAGNLKYINVNNKVGVYKYG